MITQAESNDTADRTCQHDHSKPGRFREETMPGYCKEGCSLHSKICDGGCGALFDEKLHGVTEGQMYWKPSLKNKVYTCLGREDDAQCEYALCNNCYTKHLLLKK
jgi:hypothetical protein